jgi:EAL domain-containing protein (putative c-di-GMP-specific phosphodiesterase class I)
MESKTVISKKPIDFSMAFQPIVDVVAGCVVAYEALVRGPNGQSAATVFAEVDGEDLYLFDQECRFRAISLAMNLGLVHTGASLSINFLPGAVYNPRTSLIQTLDVARALGFPTDRLIFEISETEEIDDPLHMHSVTSEYDCQGLRIAIDDFGAGYSNLNLLADLCPDIIKLDMNLIRNLHLRARAQAIVYAAVNLSKTMRMDLIAEGVETVEEYSALRACGVRLMQGYLLARPEFEKLPRFHMPEATPMRLASIRPHSRSLWLLPQTGTN